MSEPLAYAHDSWCNTAHTAGPEECPPAQETCTCPEIDITTWADLARQERHYLRGNDKDCVIHGDEGVKPDYPNMRVVRHGW